MQGRRRWDEVRCVTVSQESPVAEGKGPAVAVQAGRLSCLRVWLKHGGLLALLVLAGHFSVACLNAVLLHGEGPVHLGKDKNVITI